MTRKSNDFLVTNGSLRNLFYIYQEIAYNNYM